jgi:hypothetical protein
MGLPDLYPFVLSEPIVANLRFVHEVLQQESHKCGLVYSEQMKSVRIGQRFDS